MKFVVMQAISNVFYCRKKQETKNLNEFKEFISQNRIDIDYDLGKEERKLI